MWLDIPPPPPLRGAESPRSGQREAVLPGELGVSLWLAGLSAAFMVVGGFGPWATALGFISISGTRGDGWIVIGAGIAGIAALALSALKASAWRGLLAVLFGGVGVVTSAYDLNALQKASGSVIFFGQQLQVVRAGWGVYMSVIASGALVLLAAAWVWSYRP